MKKILLLLLVLLPLLAQAQEADYCGTPTTPSKWTEDYLSNRSAYEKSDDLLYVPVTIHIVGNNAGDGYIPVKNVLDAFCTFNESFVSSNIKFFIQGNIRYIKSSQYYIHNSTTVGRQMSQQHNINNTINIYIVENAAGNAGYSGAINSNYIVIDKSEIKIGNHTIGHEIGHALGLYHTFWGWEGYTHDYTQNAPALVNGNRAVERVDGSNCGGSGDGFCDTSPDYLPDRWQCNNQRESNVIQKDPTGATFRSDAQNIMSYANDNCVNRFSEEQKQAMRSNLLTAKRTFLSLSSPLASIDTLKVSLLYPSSGVTVDFSNVVLEWSALPDATDYLVEVSTTINFSASATTTYLVKTNSLTVSNLIDNRSYYWRVRAFNMNSTCGNFTQNARFRTGSTTSTEDLTKKVHFEIFPNPVSGNQLITIESQLPQSTRLNIRLMDVAGKLMKTTSYDVLSGENKLQFTPGNLPPGIYVMNIVGDNINVIKRLVIH